MPEANFIVRIFKSFGARDPERRWVNTYELTSNTLGSPAAIEPAMQLLVSAEKILHCTKVQFLSATISTWQADSQPYDPTSFNTYDLVGNGLIDSGDNSTGENILDSNVCYLVRRQCTSGRSGKLFYRGCLTEAEVQSSGDGRFVISANSLHGPVGSIFTAYRNALLPLLGAAEGDASLALISRINGVGRNRPVADLTVGGVSINRRNHRYYDRAA